MSSAFDTFLRHAWADDADQAEAVAARLRTGTPAPETGPADCAVFSVEEQVLTKAGAASLGLGRYDTRRAVTLLQPARRRAAAVPDAGAGVHRPLGVPCHNMACTQQDRTTLAALQALDR